MNTKGMKFLAVLAVLAMAFAAFAVVASDTGSDADGEKVTLTITGPNALAATEMNTVVAAVTALTNGTYDNNLEGATAVTIQLGPAYPAAQTEALTTFGPVTVFDLNGKDFKVAVANNDHPVVTLGANLTIKNAIAGDATSKLTIDTIDVKGKKLTVEGSKLTAVVDTYKSTVSGGSVTLDADTNYTADPQNYAVTLGEGLIGNGLTATITQPGVAAAALEADGNYKAKSKIVFTYTGEGAVPTVYMNGAAVTLGETITLRGDAAFTKTSTYVPIDPPTPSTATKITFDSITVNMLGKNPSNVNIVGDVIYTGTIVNDVEFSSLNRASVTFGTSTATPTFADGKTISFVGNMLTVGGTIKKAGDEGTMTITTNDQKGNSTTPAFRLNLSEATITIEDRLDVTGSFEAKKITLGGNELYVHQASSLKVVDFVANKFTIGGNPAVVTANEDGRFGVDVGATFTVTGTLDPEYATAVHEDNDVNKPIIGYKYNDFTYNSYVLGSFILTVDVADHTAKPNPDPVPELQKIPMFSFVYSYMDGKVLKTKTLSMLVPSNNKFPTIKAFDGNALNAGNYIKGYNEVVIGWTDVKDSKTVKYAVGDALPQTLATVYYPIYESDISNLSISGTATYAGKESDAQYLYGQEIVATNIDTGKFYTATVGQDGSFQIVNMKSGTYNIKVPTMEAQDYDVINGGSVALTLAGVTGLEVEYVSYVNITINVTSGSAVSGAVDKVNLYEDIKKTTLVASNPDGKTLTYVFKAIYSTTATDVYYAEGLDADVNPTALAGNGSVVVSYGASATFNIVLDTPTFTVSGTVKLNGEPVSGITLTLMIDDPATEAIDYTKKFGEAVTDDKGKYVFTNVPNGTDFSVVIDNEDYERDHKDGKVNNGDAEKIDFTLKAMPWMFYLTVWYNGAKVLPENLGELVVYYGLSNVLNYTGNIADIDDNQVRVDKEAKKLTIYLKSGATGFEKPGQLFVQASSYSYVGNKSVEITQNKQSIDVVLGVLNYNLFGEIVDVNGSIDPLFDMESHLTITTSNGVVTPHLVVYKQQDVEPAGTVTFGNGITVKLGETTLNPGASVAVGQTLSVTWTGVNNYLYANDFAIAAYNANGTQYIVDGDVSFTTAEPVVGTVTFGNDITVKKGQDAIDSESEQAGGTVLTITWNDNTKALFVGDSQILAESGGTFIVSGAVEFTLDTPEAEPEQQKMGIWKFYVTNLADQTTGDVAVDLGDFFKIYRPFKIESKDIGTWTFDDANNEPLTIEIKEAAPTVTLKENLMTVAQAAMVDVKLSVLIDVDDDGKETYSDPKALVIDTAEAVGYGAKIRISAVPNDNATQGLEFIVTVNGATIVLDKEGNSEILTVVESIKIAVTEPPVYTEDLLVTLGQKGQKVVVVFTALDIYDVDEDAEPVADDDPVYIQKTIPSITVNLQLNYWYLNEFGEVTPWEYRFSVEYTEKYEVDAAFEFSADKDDFVKELGENYQNAYSITGSYVFGDETIDLFKTAYKPVPAAEA